MTFALCLLYVALIYIRPGELFPQLEAVPLVAITGAAALVSATGSLFARPRPFLNLPVDWCFLGFITAAILSAPSNGWLGGAYVAAVKLFPLVTFYVLIRVAVETDRQFKSLLLLVVAATVFQAANGILQYWTGVGFGHSTAITQGLGAGDTNLLDGTAQAVITRVRGTGIFGDPNDLAMALVIACPFLFSIVLDATATSSRRLMGLLALGTVGAALVLTQSRGGLLGLAALGGAYAYRRFGRLVSVVVAIALAAVMLIAGSSRMQEMSASEESAQGRIQSWSAGLEMLRSRPVLGVGMDAYGEHHELVAHNSFVHSAAEVGLVGMYFFVGLFFWSFAGNGTSRDPSGAAASSLSLDVWASAIGTLVCALFLSRQYSPVLYVPLVLGAARLAVERTADEADDWWKARDWLTLGLVTVASLVAIYVVVRFLSVWSNA